MENADISNLIKNAFGDKPTNVQNAFGNIMSQKVSDAIASRRHEMSHEMNPVNDLEFDSND